MEGCIWLPELAVLSSSWLSRQVPFSLDELNLSIEVLQCLKTSEFDLQDPNCHQLHQDSDLCFDSDSLEVSFCNCRQRELQITDSPFTIELTLFPTTSKPTATPTTNPSHFPTTSPTLNPTNHPTVSPTLNPTQSPTQSPTQQFFPTATITTKFNLPSNGNTAPDQGFEHNIQCFFNYLFGKLNPKKYKWKANLPFDASRPEVLVPLVEYECEGETTAPTLSPEPEIGLSEDLQRVDRNLQSGLPCNIRINIHTSSVPVLEDLSFIPTQSPTSSPTSNGNLTETMDVLAFLEELKTSVIGRFSINEISLRTDDNFQVTTDLTVRAAPSSTIQYCTNEQISEITSSTQSPVATTTTQPSQVQESVGGNDSEGVKYAVSISVLVILVLCLIALYRRRIKKSRAWTESKPNKPDLFLNPNDKDVKHVFHATIKEFQETDGLKVDMKSLKLERPIGHGANGRIFKARYAGSQAAVKEIYAEQLADYFETGEITKAGNKKLQNVLREVKLLRMLRHPNIIQLFGCTFSKSDTGVWRFLVVMELAACSLLDVLEKPNSLRVKALPPILTDEKSTIAFAKQICAGCAYIHDNSMVHFDIKPANILVDFSGNAKICDLGIAKITGGKQAEMEKTQAGLGGTPPYMAPELLQGDRELIGQPVDVYAFGIVFWQLFHKKSPQPLDWTIPQLFQQVLMKDYRPPIDETLVNKRLREVLELCWHKSYKKRPTFHALMRILTDYQDDQIKKTEAILKSFDVNDDVLVWSYEENEYVLATILDTTDTGDQTIYQVQLLSDDTILENVNETDLLSTNIEKAGSNFKTVSNLALKNAANSTGKTLRVLTPLKKDKTFFVNNGKLEMQGIVFSSQGVQDNNQNGLSIDQDFILKLSMLGEGACGAVYSAIHLVNYSIVAVKEIRINEKGARHQIVKELSALWKNLVDDPMSTRTDSLPSISEIEEFPKMKCPFIVGFYGAFYSEVTNSVSLVMEYMDGGSLQDILLDNNTDITEEILANITRNILQALVFIHNMKLVHLDIKPANILINVFGQAKLADFGLAKQLEESKNFRARTFVGTMRYMSPERINAQEYGYPSDVWSLGMTLLTVALGKFPIDFESKSKTKTSSTVDSSKKSGSSEYWKLLNLFRNQYVPELPKRVELVFQNEDDVEETRVREFSFEFQSFIASCLKIDQTLRASALQLLNHPWFNDFEFNHVDIDDQARLPSNIIAVKRENLTLILQTLVNAGKSKFKDDEKIQESLAKTLYLPLELVKNEIHRVLDSVENVS